MFLRISRASKSLSTSRIVASVRGRIPVAPFITSLTSRIVLMDSLKRRTTAKASQLSVHHQAERVPAASGSND
eukprot:6213711-Pleurochrysis_carterae.AAC.3